MPPVKSLIFKYLACRYKLISLIFLFSEIMPSYSYYAKKGLVYIIIAALSNQQPSSCSKCTKSNIYLSYNICSISNAKYIYLIIHLCTL
jgi:hypothetical protein